MVDSIEGGIGRQRSRGMMGMGDGERGKFDRRDKWRCTARNSSVVGISSSRVSEVLSFQARLPADYCWRTVVSSLSLSEGKKLDDG